MKKVYSYLPLQFHCMSQLSKKSSLGHYTYILKNLRQLQFLKINSTSGNYLLQINTAKKEFCAWLELAKFKINVME